MFYSDILKERDLSRDLNIDVMMLKWILFLVYKFPS
jgi:hypothetical protein